MAEEVEKFKKAAKETFGKAESFVTEKTVSQEDRLWGALCYIIAVIMPLVVLLTDKKKNQFLRFHSYQSLILFAATIVYFIILNILEFILHMISKFLTILLIPFYWIPLIVFLLMAWKAYQGKLFKLPILGDVAAKTAKG